MRSAQSLRTSPSTGGTSYCAFLWRGFLVPSRAPSSCGVVTARVGTSVASVGHSPDTLFNDKKTEPFGIYHTSGVGHEAFTRQGKADVIGGQLNVNASHVDVINLVEPSAVSYHEIFGQSYSFATVAAMARLLREGAGLDASRTLTATIPVNQLVGILEAGSASPLDECSAALALLCEAGQHDTVVQYGSPLLKAASAAMPFFPLPGVGKPPPSPPPQPPPQQPPLPDLEHLTADLALSISLAHISLAAAGGTKGAGPTASGGGAPAMMTAGSAAGGSSSISSGGSPAGGWLSISGLWSGPAAVPTGALGGAGSGSPSGLEEAHSHLEAALQVLERHRVSPPLQQEVAYCLQGVAVALAEEVLRTTPPVAPLPTPATGPTGHTHTHGAAASGKQPALASTSTSTSSAGGGAGVSQASSASAGAVQQQSSASASGAAAAAGTANTNTAAAAAARRSKAVAMLRSALWRTVPTAAGTVSTTGASGASAAATQHLQQSHHPQQHQHQQAPQAMWHAAPTGPANGTAAGAGAGGSEAGASTTAAAAGDAPPAGTAVASAVQHQQAANSGTSGSGAGAGASSCWPPELTPEERTELMAPLRGLLTASEHIAVYGPVADRQKPYAAVQLSDQELYDLAVAHLAQGVTTGWPQHVLQALSYFERVAQQQQQHQQQQQQQHGLLQQQQQQLDGTSGASSSTAVAGAAVLTPASPSAAAAAAADVSFERSVCEALLGRRTSAFGSPDPTASPAAAPSGSTGPASRTLGTALPVSYMDDWGDHHADEATLLRRLEAQLAMAAGGGVMAATVAVGSGGGNGNGNGGGAKKAAAAAAAAEVLAAQEGVVSFMSPSLSSSPAASEEVGRLHPEDETSRRYGWAESWLELSVLPCFPETSSGAAAVAASASGGSADVAAGAVGTVSLARWFSDPRVILFNKLLAVRSGEAQVTAALGSAVAHVSEASRQRLWQLWQAAANAVSGARGAPAPSSSSSTALTAPAAASEAATAAAAAAPLASGLLAQSRAALQDVVAPRAAAAASAVAAAAAAVGSAAASSPRVVAAAASRMVPSFGLPGWGRGGGSRGGAAAVAAGDKGLAVTDTALSSGSRDVEPAAASVGSADEVSAAERSAAAAAAGRGSESSMDGNNVVPFAMPAGAGVTDLPAAQQQAASVAPADREAATAAAVSAHSVPSSTGAELHEADSAPAPPRSKTDVESTPATAAAPPSDGAGSTASGGGVGPLWVPDAEGHIRPRMVARVVQRAAASAAANLKERVASLPSPHLPHLEWSAADEAAAREAVRRVGAVAAQAVCLGALAAYVGHRILASGALHGAVSGAGGSGLGAAGAAWAPVLGETAAAALEAPAAQVAEAARAVSRWLTHADGAGEGLRGGEAAAAAATAGRPPAMVVAGVAGQEGLTTATIESVGRLAAMYGSRTQLDEVGAAALLRGWAAARAAAPALADPRDRVDLLSGLLGGRALKRARAEADRNARLGRRVDVQRLEVEVEDLRQVRHPLPPSSATTTAATAAETSLSDAAADPWATCDEMSMTAVLLTVGREATRSSPLPAAFSSRERLTVTFRRDAPGVTAAGHHAVVADGGARHSGAGGSSGLWRVVDVRDAPPSMY